MSESEVIDETATPTETGDVEVSTETDTPEPSSKEEPTDKSDADSEPALDADKSEKSDQKKLAEKSYKQRESKRVRELRHQNERLMTMLEKNQPEETKAPKVEDFETLDEYVAASVKHQIDAAKPKETSDRDPVFDQKRDDLFFEGQGKYADFAEKVSDGGGNMTPIMADAIFELDDMDMQIELAYFLANNPREAQKISRLTPLRQAAEIGKLELKLSTPEPAKRQPSTAPAPMKPVGGSKTSSNSHQPSDNYETFVKKREKELGR